MNITIAPLAPNDFLSWQNLYNLYAEFYQTTISEAGIATTWQWISEGSVRGVGIKCDGQLVGFAHWQKINRPLAGTYLAYLHDLFVLPDYRGQGLARQLIATVARTAKAEQCGKLRWATKADNTTARTLYDKLAEATDWVIYDKDLIT